MYRTAGQIDVFGSDGSCFIWNEYVGVIQCEMQKPKIEIHETNNVLV